MPSILKLKGKREDIEIDYELAVKLKTIFLDDSIPDTKRISFGSFTGTKGEIRSVWAENPYKEKKNDDFEKQNRLQMQERRDFLALTPQEKASQIGFFGFVFVGFMGRKPTNVEEAKAVDLQEKFYTKNIYRRFPDPEIFKDTLIPSHLHCTNGNMVRTVVLNDCKLALENEAYYSQLEKNA